MDTALRGPPTLRYNGQLMAGGPADRRSMRIGYGKRHAGHERLLFNPLFTLPEHAPYGNSNRQSGLSLSLSPVIIKMLYI